MRTILNALECSHCSVSISFVTRSKIRELNKRFRDLDKPTDVLSFPQYELEEKAPPTAHASPLVPLGDIVIAPAMAAANAPSFGRSTEQEIRFLLVHGALHLLGYDHHDEPTSLRMIAMEEKLMTMTDALPA